MFTGTDSCHERSKQRLLIVNKNYLFFFYFKVPITDENRDGSLDLADIDDDEINQYIMTSNEAQYKDQVWNKINAEYLQETKGKSENLF